MTIKNAAEKALHLGKQLQAVIEVGKVLDEIGDLENARQEAERDTKEARLAATVADEELAGIEHAVEVAEKDFETVKVNSKAYEDETTARCNQMMATARKERDGILTAANRGSEERVTKATQEVQALQDKRDGLLREVTTAQTAVTNLENQTRGLKERLG